MTDSSNNFMTLRPRDASKLVQLSRKTNIPLMLWGPPGVGKTSIVRDVAVQEKVMCHTIALTLMDPTDLSGLPVVNEDRTAVRWIPLGELPTGGEGYLFFDEINTADPSVMAAAMRLVLEGRLGEYTMPPGWARIAAGNRVEDAASANHMPSALSDRFMHATLEVNSEDWIDWSNNNGIDPVLTAFIAYRPQLLHDFSPRGTVNTTPRGWADVAKIITKTGGMADAVALAAVSGRVGAGPAIELRAFVETWMSLPAIEPILDGADTDSHSKMKKPAVRYAVTMALAATMADKPKPGRLKNMTAWLNNMGPEFTRLGVLAAVRRNPSLASSTDYLRHVTGQD